MDTKNVVSKKQFANTMQAVPFEKNTFGENRESQKEAKTWHKTWTDDELVDAAYNCGVFVEPIENRSYFPSTWTDLILTPDGSLEIVERSDEDTVRMKRPEGLSDTEYFWKARGECPSCRDGTSPVVMPGGWFECHKCQWRNG